ncbi:MAG: UDP-N-acetylmuramoyl-tripeptide--D-alanyl-D-alanine ligase [Sideroxydans sp.]|nr:UDP-N-acetylmuramoyl-tripeptide--D-alanyl-D-alanine ligase [Sideroxydans sp.]
MMLLSQAAQALNAQRVGEDVLFTAVSTDTRSIQAGDLFIALKGENFDGAKFVADALKAGAVAAVVSAEGYAQICSTLNPNSSILVVPDTRIALGKLAAHWRAQFDIPLVGITGSNGKTTVKEMLAAILRVAAGSEEAVLATQGNLNNDIGMPLTLLKLHAQHRYAVIEMGMNHLHEIDYLTRLARPDVAVVNNASGAHLQGLGSIEGVARAKGEIFAGLNGYGTAVINADDNHAALWRNLARPNRIFDFALAHSAAVQGKWLPAEFGGELKLRTPLESISIQLQVPGEHNARNALAAATAALSLQVSVGVIAQALSAFTGVSGRLQRKPGLHGATIMDDTYNANPASMAAALDVLAQARGKRVFVLGDMGELGEDAEKFHNEVGVAARELGIERMLALGAMSVGAVKEFGQGAQHFADIEALQIALEKEMDAQTTVLVKGSRFMKMERVVRFCAQQKEEACCSH